MRLARSHPEWVLGFADEVWFSRLAQPNLHAWRDDEALHLLEKEVEKEDAERKAIACYGLLRADTDQMLLRFVDGRPVSHVTTAFLGWVGERLAAEGKRALLLVWDNASWHISREVRRWIREHNRRVKRDGGMRFVVCALPSKSPWLNRIEPKWVHGKRAIAEPDRTLGVQELVERICAYFGCEHFEHLAQKVA
jgi:DDE superfamily endonuclease